ncbi:MAG: hypothetical protein AB8H86_24335 [Polyangiales bacterium]
MREYRLSESVAQVLRIQIRIMVGLGGLVLVMGQILDTGSDRWGSLAVAAFILFVAFGFHIALKRMNPSVVVVQPEGLRYGHIPDSPFVPWTEIRSVRERHLAQRLDLIDGDGETRISLEYNLEDFAELAGVVLEKVPLARPAPVRFRRRWSLEIFLACFLLPQLILALFVSFWLTALVVAMCGGFVYLLSKDPYAAEVTDSELILSFYFRRLTIPLQELQLASITQNHKGMSVQLLQIEDPRSKKTIVIRNVGVDMIVLKATIQEATRARPLA